ncbi:TPA: hypothetical protein ACGCMY_002900 [Klebsiella pneumoniae]
MPERKPHFYRHDWSLINAQYWNHHWLYEKKSRVSPLVAPHILSHAKQRIGAHYEAVDIQDYNLPFTMSHFPRCLVPTTRHQRRWHGQKRLRGWTALFSLRLNTTEG